MRLPRVQSTFPWYNEIAKLAFPSGGSAASAAGVGGLHAVRAWFGACMVHISGVYMGCNVVTHVAMQVEE